MRRHARVCDDCASHTVVHTSVEVEEAAQHSVGPGQQLLRGRLLLKAEAVAAVAAERGRQLLQRVECGVQQQRQQLRLHARPQLPGDVAHALQHQPSHVQSNTLARPHHIPQCIKDDGSLC